MLRQKTVRYCVIKLWATPRRSPIPAFEVCDLATYQVDCGLSLPNLCLWHVIPLFLVLVMVSFDGLQQKTTLVASIPGLGFFFVGSIALPFGSAAYFPANQQFPMDLPVWGGWISSTAVRI